MNATRSCFFLLSLLAASAWLVAEEKPRPAEADLTKTRRIERPAAEILAKTSAAPAVQRQVAETAVAPAVAGPRAAELDVTKELLIERPAVEVLVNSSAVPPVDAQPAVAGPRTIVTPDVAAQLMVAAQMARLADRGKGDIEMPFKEVLAGGSPLNTPNVVVDYSAAIGPNGLAEPSPPVSEAADAVAEEFINPKVEPGKVRWHADFAAARAAAEQSGKPVLLFQMMGKLDDRFC